MPALSHWFGLHPWDVERLWPAELDAYMTALQEIQKESRG